MVQTQSSEHIKTFLLLLIDDCRPKKALLYFQVPEMLELPTPHFPVTAAVSVSCPRTGCQKTMLPCHGGLVTNLTQNRREAPEQTQPLRSGLLYLFPAHSRRFRHRTPAGNPAGRGRSSSCPTGVAGVQGQRNHLTALTPNHSRTYI